MLQRCSPRPAGGLSITCKFSHYLPRSTRLTFIQRRINVPEMFLLADAIAITLQNVTEGPVMFPSKIHSNIMAELPFVITENIIMSLTAMGVSRQE